MRRSIFLAALFALAAAQEDVGGRALRGAKDGATEALPRAPQQQQQQVGGRLAAHDHLVVVVAPCRCFLPDQTLSRHPPPPSAGVVV